MSSSALGKKMGARLLFLALIAPFPTVWSSPNTLVDQGKIEEARDALAEETTTGFESAFAEARLSQSGAESISALKRVLATAKGAAKERVFLLLARAFQAAADRQRLASTITDYIAAFPRGELRPAMDRLSLYNSEVSGDTGVVRRRIEKLAKDATSESMSAWAGFTRARIGIRSKKTAPSSRESLRAISGQPTGDYVAPALYLLALDDAATGELDRATLNYSILREMYPHAVGIEDLIDKISKSVGSQKKKRAESFYSVQAGVFSTKAAANRQRGLFKKQRDKSEVVKARIEGGERFIVYIGQYDTWAKANAARLNLQRVYNELFLVVAR